MPARQKGTEKSWSATDNHGWQQAGEGNLKAKKGNRKLLRKSDLEKQRANNGKESKGKKCHDRAK